MAEGFAKAVAARSGGSGTWDIRSGGVETHGLNPLAVRVMGERGIDISHNASTLIDADFLNQCDVVVTLCGDARDRCPVTPRSVRRLHWPLPDPAAAVGSEGERLVVFRSVRDDISHRVDDLFAGMSV
ncbi:MAG: arsenate reductase (thioredoxin) [Bifidobacteriaceae bacterium]|jgi:arsenate reductase|nr:arsenate reductase (thioredoxin) [Bifidobacteriaceae bacterium]